VVAAKDREELVEELLTASRALVGIAIRSIAAAPVEVTVAQHRLLVLLAAHGPQSVGEIAEHLGVNPSNASRHGDRLQRMGLVARSRSADDGRVVRIELTGAGRRLLDAVTQRRREELIDLARRLPESDAAALTGALRQLNTAMDEVGDDHWEPAPAPATDAS
jgi:DNA-binding MarR family transcriptional regulator